MSRPNCWPVRTSMPPTDSSQATSCCAKSPVVLYLARPYSLRPPGFGRASNSTTAWPRSARPWAQARPAGPAPTTATRRPPAPPRRDSGAPPGGKKATRPSPPHPPPAHGHRAARARGARERRPPGGGKKGVGGGARHPADRHRLVLMGIAHTGLLAQQFGGADPGADAAERVGLQDGARRAPVVVLRNALDE